MSNISKGPRLWKRPAEPGRQALWVVKDKGKRISTGCAAKPSEAHPPEAAEQFLANYIAAKYAPERKLKDVDRILLADVLLIYHTDRRDQFEEKLQQRRFDASIGRLNEYLGNYKLSEMSQALTDGYVKHRGGPGGARRDLENLRAAINHHAKQNLHRAVVTVSLPPKGQARDRWLERSEAARLLWAAWRHREEQTIHRGKNKGIKIKTGKHTLRHLARFVLIGLYTGTRAAAIAAASPKREEGRAYVDLRAGIYYRLARGKRATTKRQPPAPLPDRLLAHMRRWVDKKIITTCFVEWNGKPIKSVKNAFARAVEVAGLDLTDGNVTAHTLRHTAATWLMQRGVDPWEAAGYLGMSVKVLIETYGHHHPNHMRGAADAITRKGRTPSVLVLRSADRSRTG
ncbi:site-specific integrase [Bradyrhizobium tropiciagri]|uniref:site-specific integrase n=1 Tax=Bradyrhizobium tropiciagri TaxID=312253 RepID=UPI001BABDC49|nr:site-specific integrase [Bradyrhizobium tropiciagri]MBR0875363.1 site-specific integrase [Bradyrhizobium tropiciagri]